MARRSLPAPPADAADLRIFMALRASARKKSWMNSPWGSYQLGPLGWRGQRSDSNRYAFDGFVVIDSKLAADPEAVSALISRRDLKALPRIPEMQVATGMAEAAAMPGTSARLEILWKAPPDLGENLQVARFVGVDGVPLADIGLHALVLVIRALGRWDRTTVGPSGAVAFWLAGRVAALVKSIPTGLPAVGFLGDPGGRVIAGPRAPSSPDAPPAQPRFPRPPALASPEDIRSWVLDVVDKVVAFFGGARFHKTLMRCAQWAVPVHEGILRFELEELRANVWSIDGHVEPENAIQGADPSPFMRTWGFVSSSQEMPAQLLEAIDYLARPRDQRPLPTTLTPAPVRNDRYQITATDGGWRLVDARNPTQRLRGVWRSPSQIRAVAWRLNISNPLATTSRTRLGRG